MQSFKVDADSQAKSIFNLQESIDPNRAIAKMHEINASGRGKAYLEGNKLVVLSLLID